MEQDRQSMAHRVRLTSGHPEKGHPGNIVAVLVLARDGFYGLVAWVANFLPLRLSKAFRAVSWLRILFR
jgi:hypothetical protein